MQRQSLEVLLGMLTLWSPMQPIRRRGSGISDPALLQLSPSQSAYCTAQRLDRIEARLLRDFPLGSVHGFGPVISTYRNTFGANELHVGDAKETEQTLQIAFLMVEAGDRCLRSVEPA